MDDGSPIDWVYLRLPKVEQWLRLSAGAIGILGTYLAITRSSPALHGWLTLTLLVAAGTISAAVVRHVGTGYQTETLEATALRVDLCEAMQVGQRLRDSLATAGVAIDGLRGQVTQANVKRDAFAAAAAASKRDLDDAIMRLTAAEATGKAQNHSAAAAEARASDTEMQLGLLRSEVAHLRELLADGTAAHPHDVARGASLARAEARADRLTTDLRNERSRVKTYAARVEALEKTESLLATARDQIGRLESASDTSTQELEQLRGELDRVKQQLANSHAAPSTKEPMSLALFVEGDHDRIVLGELFGDRLQAAGVHLITLGGIHETDGVLWGARVLQRTNVPVAVLADHTDPLRVGRRQPRTKEEHSLVELCDDAARHQLDINVFGLQQPDIVRYLDQDAIRDRCARFVDWSSAEKEWRGAGSPTPWKHWFSGQFGLELNAGAVASLVRETRSRKSDLGDLQEVVDRIIATAVDRRLRFGKAA